MLILPGSTALSSFVRDKLLRRLQDQAPAISAIEGRYIHLVDLARPLQQDERALLDRLLRYGPSDLGGEAVEDGVEFFVVPRPGTISPWSSKATDIARNCGLDAVRRLERGILFRVAGAKAGDVAVAVQLHDRMTQAVLP